MRGRGREDATMRRTRRGTDRSCEVHPHVPLGGAPRGRSPHAQQPPPNKAAKPKGVLASLVWISAKEAIPRL